MKALLFSLWAVALLLAGCGPVDRETAAIKRSPTCSIAPTAAMVDAEFWKQRDPDNRHWAPVAKTGSMMPFISSSDILLFEAVRGPVKVGQWILVEDGPMHEVTFVNENGSFIMSGVNNDRPDGWFPASRAKWRHVGVLRTSGGP
jgi:hypothetical protein